MPDTRLYPPFKDLPCLAQATDLSCRAREKCHSAWMLDKRFCHQGASETKFGQAPFRIFPIHRQVVDVTLKWTTRIFEICSPYTFLSSASAFSIKVHSDFSKRFTRVLNCS
ncbi:hypothetical protein CDAR_533681 [Caerostris darwini]|uniref:Uncharacterized protein n=1 Tax=Caerostris darwini TaxID=1538125 RepID=A0AAV4S5K0_9ARAC|nr:hypothetical protein CDAR_533681 [Caerostris darwini]